VLATLLCSCHSYDASQIPKASTPTDGELMIKGINDPIESVNRASFALNTVLFDYVVYPTMKGYRWLIPKPGRQNITNFHQNLNFPVRLVNNTLQAQWEGSWVETKRFGINTTVGLLGLYDPATTKYELRPSNEDLGITFGKWGWHPQIYLFLPLLGPSSGRDLVGMYGDSYLKPTSYIEFPYNYASEGFLTFNDMTPLADSIHDLLVQNYDPYELTLLLYSASRAAAVRNYAHNDESANDAETQTLRAIFAKPKNPNFKKMSIDDSAKIEGWKKELPYSIWLQPEPAPLMVQLPGLGSFRKGNMDLALAELAYDEGYSVLIFSNTFNWEFMTAAPPGYAPGYVEKDKALLRSAYHAIMKDLDATHGKEHFKERSLIGMSMGAWYTLNLGADLRERGSAYDVGHVIAINPPANLLKSLAALDNLYRAPYKNGDMAAAKEIIDSAISKALISAKSNLTPTSKLPFTSDEASYLIGLNFRLTLHEAIIAGAFNQELNIFGSKGALYKDLDALSFHDYYQKIAVQINEREGVTQEQIEFSINLQNRQDDLEDLKDLHLVLCDNDFLLNKEELNWFKETFAGKTTVFKQGGHLGELWRPELQDAIRSQIKLKK
jgi:ABC-type transporter lipoprotein component MlaA/pimeloyl-ACP methyl ester carboxylesterase